MKNRKSIIKSILIGGLCFTALNLSAETLSIINQPENSADGVLRPERGMQMQQVEATYGSPVSVNSAVGEPPITSWVYEDYTVYFEHEYVIHSAVHH